MAIVDEKEAVKHGGKGCIDFAVPSKTYHLVVLKVSLCLFSSCFVDILIPQRIVGAPILPADNPVRTLEEESRLNSILMLGDCVGERLTLEVVLRYRSCKLAIAISFCCKVLRAIL